MGCNSSKGYDGHDGLEHVNHDMVKKSAALKAEALRVADEMIAQTKGRRFHESYTRLTLTSYGASCKVLTAYHRTTNKKVAVKTIPKSRKQQDRQRQRVKLEIGTFRMVEDHPNAVRALEIFEGAECYYIVMECCEGGELFDHISKKQGCFTERQAAQLLRSLMLFLAHMHSKGIAHLDIKPENLMFDSEGAAGVLKVLDFGSSVFVQPSETVRNAFGTVRYASPEMANDVCGQKADVWSAGVVMYILLCGRAPFLRANDTETLNLIKSSPRVKFSGERWTSISSAAKECIRAMLDPDPRTRPTAVEVLAMPWLKQQVPETLILPDTLQHLRTFANQSRIRRLLLGLMADQLVGSGANQLLGQFYTLDKDFSGTLEVAELVKAAQEAIPELSEDEINRMFEALDVDRTGTVDVKEFFAGLIQTIDEEKQTLVAQKSFTILDKRGSGYVTKEVFMEVLLERVQQGAMRTLEPPTTPQPGSSGGGGGGMGAGSPGQGLGAAPAGQWGQSPALQPSQQPHSHEWGQPSYTQWSGPSVSASPCKEREGEPQQQQPLYSPQQQQQPVSPRFSSNGVGCMSGVRGGRQGRQSGADGGEAPLMLDPALVSELEAEFAQLDANGDGVLSFEEFKSILGIQSTPEGLQLAQPQLAAVPSLQEGMETLAQTLRTRSRTRTRTSSADEHSHVISPGNHAGTGAARAASTAGGRGNSVSGNSGAIIFAGRSSHCREHSRDPPRGQQGERGGGGGGMGGAGDRGTGGSATGAQALGRGSTGGSRGASVGVSVDRAALDLELPYDLETRDLLQLLAPAKRTPSVMMHRSQSQQPFGSRNGGSVSSSSGGGGGGGGGAYVYTSVAGFRLPSKRDPGGNTRDPASVVIQRAASVGPSRSPSSGRTTSIPTLLLLDKAPSMRAPSLPPLLSMRSGRDAKPIVAIGAWDGPTPVPSSSQQIAPKGVVFQADGAGEDAAAGVGRGGNTAATVGNVAVAAAAVLGSPSAGAASPLESCTRSSVELISGSTGWRQSCCGEGGVHLAEPAAAAVPLAATTLPASSPRHIPQRSTSGARRGGSQGSSLAAGAASPAGAQPLLIAGPAGAVAVAEGRDVREQWPLLAGIPGSSDSGAVLGLAGECGT